MLQSLILYIIIIIIISKKKRSLTGALCGPRLWCRDSTPLSRHWWLSETPGPCCQRWSKWQGENGNTRKCFTFSLTFVHCPVFYEMVENVQTSSIGLWWRAHLTGFAQEVYRIVSFQKGWHCEAVVERQITICVSLRLEQRSSCSVSDECNIWSQMWPF